MNNRRNPARSHREKSEQNQKRSAARTANSKQHADHQAYAQSGARAGPVATHALRGGIHDTGEYDECKADRDRTQVSNGKPGAHLPPREADRQRKTQRD